MTLHPWVWPHMQLGPAEECPGHGPIRISCVMFEPRGNWSSTQEFHARGPEAANLQFLETLRNLSQHNAHVGRIVASFIIILIIIIIIHAFTPMQCLENKFPWERHCGRLQVE